jgi:phosphoglycerate dehydrogenase-like enzyme
MKVVSLIKIKSSIQDHMINDFPEVDFSFYKSADEAKAEISSAEVIITYGELDAALLDQAKNLKWISVFSAGVDNLPFEAIKKQDLVVTNVKGIHKIPMSEYVISMILQYYRSAKQLIENEKNAVWDQRVKMGEINERTLLLLGTGAIGGEIARLAKAFNMHVIGVNRSGRDVENVDEVFSIDNIRVPLAKSDIIVSVLPSTYETRHLLKGEHFSEMKDDALFISIGRGDIVEEEVLIHAVEQGEIGHTILDVFEKEPLDQEHPFWNMKEVTVTPHISGISKFYQERCYELFKNNLNRYISGETLLNQIDPEKGY